MKIILIVIGLIYILRAFVHSEGRNLQFKRLYEQIIFENSPDQFSCENGYTDIPPGTDTDTAL